jgi:homoserine O-succinyltransferase
MDMQAAATRISILLVCFTQGETRRHIEQQFSGIFAEAIRNGIVQLDRVTLEPMDKAATTAILQAADPDALIVTGMQPRTAALVDDPFWPAFTALVDFATSRALPAVWSCLAAHAAVLHLDGIERRRLPQKLTGLAACRLVEAKHNFVAGLPSHWLMPHSRYNDVSEVQLASRGYRILSSLEPEGADIFAHDSMPHFLFCQGHPEYDAHALLREYRRDISQFLAGGVEDYPAAPQFYFSPGVLSLLDSFRQYAELQRTPKAMAAFPAAACTADVTHSWRDIGARLFINWLACVQAARASAHEAAPGW